MHNNRKKTAFSLVELSIVLLIISLLVISVVAGSVLIKVAKLSGARQITLSSPIVRAVPDLGLWLETSLKESYGNVAKVDGDTVTLWQDINKVSTSYAATTTDAPIYDEDDIGGIPGIKFNGTSNFMQIPAFRAEGFMTLFVVGKFAGSNFLLEHGADVSANDGFFFSGTSAIVGFTSPSIITRTVSAGNAADTNWFGDAPTIGVMRYDGANISYKRNGDAFTDLADATVIDSATVATLNIGARNGVSNFSDGSFGEIILYNRALDNDEVDSILEYLNAKWDAY